MKSSQRLNWLFALSLTAVTLACAAVCLQCKNSKVFCSHCTTMNVLLRSWLKVHWKLKACWGCAAASNIVQVWETDRWQECKHLHLSLQLREGFKVWVCVQRGLRLLFEVRRLANFNNWFCLSQNLNQSQFVLIYSSVWVCKNGRMYVGIWTLSLAAWVNSSSYCSVFGSKALITVAVSGCHSKSPFDGRLSISGGAHKWQG